MQISELRTMVLSVTPGVPASVADMQIRAAARDFFARTQRWRHVPDPIILVNGLNQYEIEPPVYTSVSRVLRVSHKSVELEAADEIDLQTKIANGESGMTHYAVTGAGELLIGPSVTVDRERALVEVTLVPSLSAGSYPDLVVSAYVQDIVNGALANVFSMPQAWKNPAMAGAYRAMFEQGIMRAKAEREMGLTNVNRTVRYGGI